MDKLKSYENDSEISTDPDAKSNRKFKKLKTHSESDFEYKQILKKKELKSKSLTPFKVSSIDEGKKNNLPSCPQLIQPKKLKSPSILKCEKVSLPLYSQNRRDPRSFVKNWSLNSLKSTISATSPMFKNSFPGNASAKIVSPLQTKSTNKIFYPTSSQRSNMNNKISHIFTDSNKLNKENISSPSEMVSIANIPIAKANEQMQTHGSDQNIATQQQFFENQNIEGNEFFLNWISNYFKDFEILSLLLIYS